MYYENSACISIAEASADKEPQHMASEPDRVSAFREMHRTHTNINDKCEALAYCSLVTKCKYKWTYSTLSLKINRVFYRNSPI